MMPALLKLLAKDAEDIQVISAVLQDSIVPICDMIYRPESKDFVFVAQRLCRETGDGQKFERICCAATIQGVTGAQIKGIDLNDAIRMLDLLMMDIEGNNLILTFAADARVKLNLAADWQIVVEDFGESWPSACNPCHDGLADIKL
jgi:hypothetical protein